MINHDRGLNPRNLNNREHAEHEPQFIARLVRMRYCLRDFFKKKREICGVMEVKFETESSYPKPPVLLPCPGPQLVLCIYAAEHIIFIARQYLLSNDFSR